MGLFGCLVYALQTKSSLATSGTINGGSPPLLVTIPDIIIFFAICQSYLDLQTHTDPDDIRSFSGDNPAIKTIDEFSFDDFTLENYNPHPAIKAAVAV